MTETEERRQLEEQLWRVKQEMELLNMIEERLLRMRELAQSVIKDNLTQQQIQVVNEEFKTLQAQVDLLNLPDNLQS